jgi:quinol-cytochrome oxidoreductase complex cytochrome b subunit
MARRSTFFHHLHPPTIPRREARFRYTFGLGGVAVFLFAVLVATGLLEMFYYVPSLERANASVQMLTFLVPYGWLVRGVHYWAAQGLVVIAVLHLLRVVLTGAYKSPRRFNWLLGVSLLVLVVLLDFTGYVLRWDSDIEWALLVAEPAQKHSSDRRVRVWPGGWRIGSKRRYHRALLRVACLWPGIDRGRRGRLAYLPRAP